MRNQIRLFVTNVNEAINSESSISFRKLKIPKKVVVNDIKCHPIEAKCAVACSDGLVSLRIIIHFKFIDQNLGSHWSQCNDFNY